MAMKNLFNFARSGVFTKFFILSVIFFNSKMPVNPAYSVTEVIFQTAATREQISHMAEIGPNHHLALTGALFGNIGLTNYWRSHPKIRAESRAQAEWRKRRVARRLFKKIVALVLVIFFIWICFKAIGAFLSLFD